jgi:hypothetical protein
MQNFLMTMLMACPILPLAAQNHLKTMLRLPDTGQVRDYATVYGEDSDYMFNLPYFILHGDGTVTDTVTGLMWQQADGGEMTFENAGIYCDTLSLGGFTDWRIPNPEEAFSILNHDRSNPALDLSVFVDNDADYWWTGTHQVNDDTKIWVTNAGGGIGNHPKSETISAGGVKKFNIRAVRDTRLPQEVSERYRENGDGTVEDLITGLVWQSTPWPDTLSWEEALAFAEDLAMGTHEDWRLPNIKELRSLSNEGFVNPSVDPLFFPGIGVKKYWSSTSLPNQVSRAWFLDTRFGISTHDLKSKQLNVLCVRGPSHNTTPVIEFNNREVEFTIYPNPFNSILRLYSVERIWKMLIFPSCHLGYIFYG